MASFDLDHLDRKLTRLLDHVFDLKTAQSHREITDRLAAIENSMATSVGQLQASLVQLHGAIEGLAAERREDPVPPGVLRVRVSLTVDYDLAGGTMGAAEVAQQLGKNVSRATGEGMLTRGHDLCVESHDCEIRFEVDERGQQG